MTETGGVRKPVGSQDKRAVEDISDQLDPPGPEAEDQAESETKDEQPREETAPPIPVPEVFGPDGEGAAACAWGSGR